MNANPIDAPMSRLSTPYVAYDLMRSFGLDRCANMRIEEHLYRGARQARRRALCAESTEAKIFGPEDIIPVCRG